MCEPPIDAVAALLSRTRFTWVREDGLQAGIASVCIDAGWSTRREVRLSADARVDVLVGAVAVEVKVAPVAQYRLLTQIGRYLASPQVTGLVLASTVPGNVAALDVLGGTLAGKPVVGVQIAGWLL